MKAHWWVLILLLGAVLVQIASEEAALMALKQRHPVQAVQIVNPKLVLYVIVGTILLWFLADVAPEMAVGIAALLFLGAALQKGTQALSVLKGGQGAS